MYELVKMTFDWNLCTKETSRQVEHDVQEHTKTEIRQNTKGTEQTSMPSTMPKRIRRLSNSDVLGPSMPIGSMPMSGGVTIDSDKPPTGLLSGEQSLHVSSLLNSLGLGKYAINFLAEEVSNLHFYQTFFRIGQLGVSFVHVRIWTPSLFW